MSWEIDVFGSIRKRVKAQKENFAASKEEYAAVMVSLASEVASAYINLRELQQELEVVNKNVASQEEVLKITEVRYNTGLVAKLDVAQAKSVLYSTKASIPQLEAGINQYITTLAVLLGMYPQEIRPVLETTGTLPDYMEPIGVGMPVDLLLRRPDVRSAERSVNAQAALLGASKSDWLPKIFLKGSFGYAARDLNDLVKSKSMTYEIAPSLSWTIFSGGQLVNATPLHDPKLYHIRDLFLFSCYTGIPYGDMCRLTTEDLEVAEDGEVWIKTARKKTKIDYEVPLLDIPLLILDKYRDMAPEGKLLPMYSNNELNRTLKRIAAICGIERKLVFHCGRHTYATEITLSHGVPLETVSKMLGHSRISTTQIYAKVTDDKIDMDTRSLEEKIAGRFSVAI